MGLGEADGRDEFTDIPFVSLAKLAEASDLDDTVVFVNDFAAVATKNRSFQILHVPPPLRDRDRALPSRAPRPV